MKTAFLNSQRHLRIVIAAKSNNRALEQTELSYLESSPPGIAALLGNRIGDRHLVTLERSVTLLADFCGPQSAPGVQRDYAKVPHTNLPADSFMALQHFYTLFSYIFLIQNMIILVLFEHIFTPHKVSNFACRVLF